MAKGKHAAALFEVINKEVRQRPHVRTERTPLRWLRKRNATNSIGGRSTVTVDVSNDPTMRPHPLLRNHQSLGVVEIEPDRPLREPAVSRTPVAGPIPMAPAVTVDRSRQLIRFRLSYTSAAVAGFALVVAVVMAYVIGRGVGREPAAPVASVTTEELQRGPSNPAVLEVSRSTETQRVADQITLAERNPTPTPVPPPPAANAKGEQRIVGMNYVIIQSYPEQEEAQQAAELLRQYGIPCTVEKGTPYAPRWYSVVGLQPFDQMSSNPQYTAYVKQIQTISNKFAGNSKFKRFEPKPFKWQKK